MKHHLISGVIWASGLFYFSIGPACHAQEASIFVKPDKVEQTITPFLYGACIEDVNHEIYGGLYDQKIFGESFEEPVPRPKIDNFSEYEGIWKVQGNELTVRSHPGAKLVYTPQSIRRGYVETSLRFDEKGENAGLIVCLSQPGKGADNFYGYEVSLAADGRKVVIGMHQNDFKSLAEIPVKCSPEEWNRLRVSMQDNDTIEVFLNEESIYKFHNTNKRLQEGNIALRTWNSNVRFRDIKLSDGTTERRLSLRTTPQISVSAAWDAIQTGSVKTTFGLDMQQAYNGRNSQTIELISGTGTVGIANSGLNRWGIAVKKDQTYQGGLYLKGLNLEGKVFIALQNKNGTTEYARQEIEGIDKRWKKYHFKLTSKTTDPNARFAVYIDKPGKLWIDQATLMNTEDNQFKGLPYRKDIAEAMVNEGLTFLRYGGTMINVPGYRFKKMIGNPDNRPPYRGHWYRYSTNGFGIEDFLKFCEAAGFTPAFAINIEENPRDIADMVEYLNGSVTSKWGKQRAKNGHPAPYGVKYIGIGNEEVLFNGDNAREYDHYVNRFILLHDAIKRKDPSIKLISTAWWRPESPSMERTFKALDGKADYWDFHPWADDLDTGKKVETELRRMKELFLKWNPDTKIKCAIFEENGNTHNMQRALGHVTLQNAVRRMGDFVLTSCAANALQPYKQNDNGWDQGQIFFTPDQVWGMPPYYAQQMASKYHQPFLVESTTTDPKNRLDVTATRSKDGNTIVLHVANTDSSSVSARIVFDNFRPTSESISVTLCGKLQDVNTPHEPQRITPVEQSLYKNDLDFYMIQPYSYTIFVFKKE